MLLKAYLVLKVNESLIKAKNFEGAFCKLFAKKS